MAATPFSRDMVLLPVLDRSIDSDVSEDAARLLKLLADPTRRRVFLALMAGEICNCELSDRLGLAQNLISHHIRQLRESGLVRERRDARDGRWIYYTVDEHALTRAWSALEKAFGPSALGRRSPECGAV